MLAQLSLSVGPSSPTINQCWPNVDCCTGVQVAECYDTYIYLNDVFRQ